MFNVRLRYLIIAVIILSILMLSGTMLFVYINRNKPLPGQQTNTSKAASTPQPGTNTTTPKIRIIYPSRQATKSATPSRKPAPALQIGIMPSSGSANGSGPIPKNIPKP